MVDPGDNAGHTVLGLGEQRDDEVHLVVPARGDDHVAAFQPGVVERDDLAGVGQQPLRARHRLDLDRPWILVDEQDLVAVLQELLRDGAAHGTRSGDGDPHYSTFSSGRCDTASLMRSMSEAAATTWT